VITVERSDTAKGAVVRFHTIGRTPKLMDNAESPWYFRSVKSGVKAPDLTFAPGQASATFTIPIVDHGFNSVPVHLGISLYGPFPIGLTKPSRATLTILDNDPDPPPVPDDPLGLPGATIATNPLRGARFFVDPQSEAARAARRYPALKVIADQPGAGRFGAFSYPNARLGVSNYLARARQQDPGAIPILTTYRLVSGQCEGIFDTVASETRYARWIEGLAAGIGTYPAVLAMEQDSLITATCLNRQQLDIRIAELRLAIDVLTERCPNLVIYLDAGAADALPAARAAELLKRAGLAKIQGFFLDATHFDWTSKEIRYGEKVSTLTGGKHFIVSTGESGRGPLSPGDRREQGNEVLCNPSDRGLGPKPTTDTGYRNVDAFVWLDNPGGSSGTCLPGAPPAGEYWPQYALMLVKNANFKVR
jgi:endoglucanase